MNITQELIKFSIWKNNHVIVTQKQPFQALTSHSLFTLCYSFMWFNEEPLVTSLHKKVQMITGCMLAVTLLTTRHPHTGLANQICCHIIKDVSKLGFVLKSRKHSQRVGKILTKHKWLPIHLSMSHCQYVCLFLACIS